MIDNSKQIRSIFVKYYLELIGHTSNTNLKVDYKALLDMDQTNLSILETRFLEEKIKNAIFSLAKDKALGLDDFLVSFYQHYRLVIKNDLSRLLNRLYNNHMDIARLKFGFVTLIPKKLENYDVKDYRLISLIHGIMKIFFKILSSRLTKHMNAFMMES